METIDKLKQIDAKVNDIFGKLLGDDLNEADRKNYYIEQKVIIGSIKNTLTSLVMSDKIDNNTAVLPFAKAILSSINSNLTKFGEKYLTITNKPAKVEEKPVLESIVSDVLKDLNINRKTRPDLYEDSVEVKKAKPILGDMQGDTEAEIVAVNPELIKSKEPIYPTVSLNGAILNTYMISTSVGYKAMTMSEESLLKYLDINYSDIELPEIFIAQRLNIQSVSAPKYKIINSEVK